MLVEPLESRLCQSVAHVAPYDLVASVLPGSAVELAWRDDTKTTAFVVERSFAGGKFHIYARVRGHSYTDPAVGLPGVYKYRIEAANSPTLSNTAVIGSLTNFRASPILDSNRWGVQLQWFESDPTVFGYQISRSADGGQTWEQIYAGPASTAGDGDCFWFDFPVPDGTTLTYGIAEIRG